ncbi:PREDICTED: aspartic proteinase-like protein 1 [Erythranthe guttata]|uniref:aspartic proteinase-like protein 1 n=1 Tax=Erythranthe guttata TaxID=4155 RepID=UPI00064D86AB|nr:PREDICTED: aspartic proteinase-like protein 1 [Erythranthe guttata]|eukprot:XP_012837915.1 PREDICTED: aspartic proteinase-like protein 1 [Erythranthe guttata]
MKGGSQFNVTVPTIQFEEDDGSVFCLALIKSEGINVIGQNFMTGYRIVFDREEMLLGWKESDCYDSISSSAQPPPKRNSTRSRAAEQSPPPLAPPPSGVARLSSVTSGLMAVMLAVLFHNFIALSS